MMIQIGRQRPINQSINQCPHPSHHHHYHHHHYRHHHYQNHSHYHHYHHRHSHHPSRTSLTISSALSSRSCISLHAFLFDAISSFSRINSDITCSLQIVTHDMIYDTIRYDVMDENITMLLYKLVCTKQHDHHTCRD